MLINHDVTRRLKLEEQLRQSQKMEAIGTLAGGIAHDFNNLLNPIFINRELVLLDPPLGTPMRQPLKLVLDAAERRKGLVNPKRALPGKWVSSRPPSLHPQIESAR